MGLRQINFNDQGRKMNETISLQVTLTLTGDPNTVREIPALLEMIQQQLLEDIVTIVEVNLQFDVGGAFETTATLQVTPADR